MSQTIAILHDSLRYVRSRSLFWIALSLSALVAIILFGMIGFDEQGWTMLWFDTNESDVLQKGSYASRQLLSWLFGGAFVFWWLSWGAIILALISTASIMPDFVASGAIDLTLAKPIGRLKLLLVKVVGALLFMLLQVTISVLLAYLLVGLRFGMWFHEALWSIPLLTIQFLYLYVVMAFVGLVTRSPLASLLACLVFWSMVSIVQFTTNQMDSTMAESRTMVERLERRCAEARDAAKAEQRELTPPEQLRIDRWERDAKPHRRTLETIEPWARPARTLELCIPKTGDIQKIIARQVEAPTFNELVLVLGGFDEEAMAAMTGITDRNTVQDLQHSGIAGAKAARRVETAKSLGTSLVFTVIVLGLSVLVFRRRDF